MMLAAMTTSKKMKASMVIRWVSAGHDEAGAANADDDDGDDGDGENDTRRC